MSIRDELIGLYGSGIVADVEQSRAFNLFCAKHRQTEGFETERLRIRSFRKNLEDLCREQTLDAQIRLCLKLLTREKKKEADRDDYHDLIKIAYCGHWSEVQKAHFDKAFTILKGNNYFFLSFTTRSNTPQHVSKVNRENRYFLQDVFWPEELNIMGDLNRENMLAEAIFRYLEDQGLSGYYFPGHAGLSDNVEDSLRANLENSMVFLQLVQGVMFEDKTPNYCHFEYEEARKSRVCCKRIYVMGEERADILARKNDVPDSLLPWFNETLNEVGALALIPTRYRDDDAVKKNHDELKNKIVRQIERIRDELFDNIPT